MAIVASGLTPGAVRRDLIGECYSSTVGVRDTRAGRSTVTSTHWKEPPKNNNKKKERKMLV